MFLHTLSSDYEGAKELGVPIFPIYSLSNGGPRSYREFPNHLLIHDVYNLRYIFESSSTEKIEFHKDTEAEPEQTRTHQKTELKN